MRNEERLKKAFGKSETSQVDPPKQISGGKLATAFGLTDTVRMFRLNRFQRNWKSQRKTQWKRN